MAVGLSDTIEYIASLQRPGGGLIVSQAHRQDLIVGFPPSTTSFFYTAPAEGLFAMIVYNYQFGEMTPNAFSYSFNYTGVWVSNGILTRDMLERNIDFFMVITRVNPILLYITNRDVIPHQWEANMYYLTVSTWEDMIQIADALRERGGQSRYMAEILRALNPELEAQIEANALPRPLYVG